MFALVRFVDDHDNKRLHIVSTSIIDDFSPTSTDDFDKKSTYTVFHEDAEGNGENTGFYNAHVLLLAETEEELTKKKESKRIAFPKARPEESSDEDASSKKTQQKKVSQRKKQLRTASKTAVYSEILEKHLHHAHESTKTGPSDRIHREQSVPKRLRQESISSSGEDDSLCSTTELRQAQAEARAWKTKARQLEDDKDFLKEQVSSLQRCLESKIFQLEKNSECKDYKHEEVEDLTEAQYDHLVEQHSEAVAVSTNTAAGAIMQEAAHQAESLPCTTYPVTRCDPGVLQQCAVPAACASAAAAAKKSPAPRVPPGACQVSTGPAVPAGIKAGSAKNHAPVPPAFTHLPDGTFHLANGIVISSGQAAKIFRGKKPTIVGKETAQAIWTNAVLATRSVTGTMCPQKRAAGESAKPPLTPEKIDVVKAAIFFWGEQKKQSAAAAAVVSDIGNLLREKCQDARRSEERMKKMSHNL